MKDKIVFWLDGDLTTFGIAKCLQETYQCDINAIIDITDRAKIFFQEQQLVRFDKIWFYHDHVLPESIVDMEYLSNFEKKYTTVLIDEYNTSKKCCNCWQDVENVKINGNSKLANRIKF